MPAGCPDRSIDPAAAHRVTVFGSTRKSTATSPGVSNRSTSSMIITLSGRQPARPRGCGARERLEPPGFAESAQAVLDRASPAGSMPANTERIVCSLGSTFRWELGVEDDLPASRPVSGSAGPSRMLIQLRHATPTFPTSQSRHPGSQVPRRVTSPSGARQRPVTVGRSTPAVCSCSVKACGVVGLTVLSTRSAATRRSGMFRFCETVRSTSTRHPGSAATPRSRWPRPAR